MIVRLFWRVVDTVLASEHRFAAVEMVMAVTIIVLMFLYVPTLPGIG